MDLQIALDEQHVISLPLDRVKALAAEMVEAAERTECAARGGNVRLEIPSLNWSGDLTPAQAKRLAAHLKAEAARLPAQEEEQRRAAGYSPIAEQGVVIRDERGEIVQMEKTFSY